MNERKKHKKEKLSNEDSKWLEVINLNNCQNVESRKQIKQVLEELKKIDGLVMQKICTHDLSAKLNGRVLCRICPLKQGWSGSITTGNIKKYEVNQFIEELQKAHKEMPKPRKNSNKSKLNIQLKGEEAVKFLEEKVAGLSKTSKGFQVPSGIRVTDPEVKDWIKENQYSAVADKIMLNRVP